MFTNLIDAIALSEPQRHGAGDVLFRQGSEHADVFLVANGFVDLVATNPSDGLERAVSWRGPGHLIGHARAVLSAPAPVAARTATPCLLHRIPASTFLRIVTPDRAPVLWQLVRERSRELLELTTTMGLFAAGHARQRLEYVLWRLFQQQRASAGAVRGRETRLVDYSPTNKELAGYIGVNPTYVPELFGAMERDGIARRHRGFIVVDDASRLFRPPAAVEHHAPPWRALFGLGVPRRFDAGYSLFEQHDPAEEVYFVDSGFVDLSASVGDGSDVKPLWWSSGGTLLGDGAAVLGTAEHVTATTRTRSFLHRLSAKSFLAALGGDRDPALYDLLLALSDEVHTCTNDVAVVRQPLRQALEHVLQRLVEQHVGTRAGGDVELTAYSPNNATLAGYIGTEERYLSHLLQQLKAEQVAWRGAGRVITVRQTLAARVPPQVRVS